MNTVRDLTYIEDTINAFCLCLKNNNKINGQTINLGTGKGILLKDIAKTIAEKYKKEIIFLDNKKITYLVANIDKLLNIYKFKVPKKIEEIIF